MFEKGDVVQLKSGGPNMTVARVKDDGTVVTCVWFTGDKERSGYFDPATIIKVEVRS